MTKKPLIGIACCSREIDDLPFYISAERYCLAVREASNCIPVLIPSLESTEILQHLDGILLTGSVSNIEPHHYGGTPSTPGTLHDPQRDKTTLKLIKEAIKIDMPLFAICRGNQELNVALGGTLHQKVHEVESRFDHREDTSVPKYERFGKKHSVDLSPNGFLSKLYNTQNLMVNSLHEQAIDQLAEDLTVEAKAEDGTIEAVKYKHSENFIVGVQWHPEWKVQKNRDYFLLFNEFGKYCYEYKQRSQK